ncbi:MAG: DUF2029 domain-containing protein [Solirubrobacterales bacterium]|nr:DUF2029 domain-containing protein [Solirubrobacterales bacterium]
MIFVPYLLFSRRRRAAAVALAAFAATAAIGYALLPGDSQRFWGGLFLDSHRVGGCCAPVNRSLRGAILRLAPSADSGLVLGIAIVTGIVGVTLAVLASRRGDDAMGFSRCAITGLLVSPVSWTHHWTLAVPALLVLGARVSERRAKTGVIAFAAVVLVAFSYLPKLMQKPGFLPPSHLPLGWALASAPYVLIGVVALVVAGLQETARWADAVGRTPHPTRSSRVLFRLAPTRARSYAAWNSGDGQALISNGR